MDTIAAVVKKANANHQRVIINPAPAQILDDEILKGLFLIAPNEAEASLLTGISVADEKSAAQAAEVLLNNGVQNVIITLGKKGAYFQNKELKLLVNAPVVQALDTTAAGDTFSGALAVALTENLDQTAIGWEMAIQFAVEAASISVTRLGAQASVPYRNEIEVLL
jgi:ribokinase